jgi:hypothetical protein
MPAIQENAFSQPLLELIIGKVDLIGVVGLLDCLFDRFGERPFELVLELIAPGEEETLTVKQVQKFCCVEIAPQHLSVP